MNNTFEQDRHYSREILVLEDRQFTIRGRLALVEDITVWLRDVDPLVYVIKKRFFRIFVIGAAIGSSLIGFSWYLLSEYGTASPGMDLASYLLIALAWSPVLAPILKPIKAYQIRLKNGTSLVEIYATKRKRFKSEDFIEAFRKRMESEYAPNQPPLRMPVSGTPAADAPVAPPPGIAGR